eukprot:403359695
MWPFTLFSQLKTIAVSYVPDIFTSKNQGDSNSSDEGGNSECSYSSAEERDCDSDCSLCITYSLNTSQAHSNSLQSNSDQSNQRQFFRHFLERGSQRSSIQSHRDLQADINQDRIIRENQLDNLINDGGDDLENQEVALDKLQQEINSYSSSKNSSAKHSINHYNSHNTTKHRLINLKINNQRLSHKKSSISSKKSDGHIQRKNQNDLSQGSSKRLRPNNYFAEDLQQERIQQNNDQNSQNSQVDVIDLENIRESKKLYSKNSQQFDTKPKFTLQNPFISTNQNTGNPYNFNTNTNRKVMQNPLVNDQTSKKRKADQMSQSVFLQERDNSIQKEEQQHQNSLQDVYDYDQYDRNLSKKVTPHVNKSQAKIENIFFQKEEEKSSQRVQNQKVEIILDSDTEEDHKNAQISKNKSIPQQILERRAQNQTFNYSDYKKNLKDRQLCDSLLQDLAQISIDDSKLNIQETFQREIGQFLQDFTIKDDTVLIDNEKMSHPLTKSSLRKLEKGQWFNDEIINSYIELINHEVDKKISTPVYTQTRSTQNSSKIAPKPLILNTFFYTKLEQEAQKSSFSTRMLERFIKKQAENVQTCEIIIIPINQVKMHWYLVVIDLVSQKYYIVDSMYHPQIKAMTTVANLRLFFDTFLSQNRALDPSKWTFEVLEYVPKQNNGHDCGMCVCLNIRHFALTNQQLSDNKIEKFGYEINDETSVKMRMKIGVELLKFKLLA